MNDAGARVSKCIDAQNQASHIYATWMLTCSPVWGELCRCSSVPDMGRMRHVHYLHVRQCPVLAAEQLSKIHGQE